MTFRDRHLESIVGGFLLASMASFLLFVVFAAIGGGWFTPTNRYQLVLEHGTGITPGADVTIAGMKVGRVTSVSLTDERRVLLILDVDRTAARHIRVDSVGSAAMTLTGKTIAIEGGTDAAAELTDGGQLVSGENFDLFKALEEMDLVGNLQRIQRILEDLNVLASQLQLGDGRLPEAVDAMVGLVTDLQAGKGTIGALLKDDHTLEEIREAVVAVERMSGSVEKTAGTLSSTALNLDRASGAVVETTKPIVAASQALGTTATSVSASAADLSTSLERLEGALVELERTMRAIQNMPLVRGQVRKADEEAAAQ